MEGLEALKFGAPPYKPVPPQRLFFTPQEWSEALGRAPACASLSPFEEAERPGAGVVRSMAGRAGRNFAAERAAESLNLFATAASHVAALQAQGKRVILAAFTAGARERLAALLRRQPARQCAQSRELRRGRGAAARR